MRSIPNARAAIAMQAAASAILAAIGGRTDDAANDARTDMAAMAEGRHPDGGEWDADEAAWAIEQALEAVEPCEGDAWTVAFQTAQDRAYEAQDALAE